MVLTCSKSNNDGHAMSFIMMVVNASIRLTLGKSSVSNVNVYFDVVDRWCEGWGKGGG